MTGIIYYGIGYYTTEIYIDGYCSQVIYQYFYSYWQYS
jgi:hypothetical protein